ncbi:glycosyltransferase [Streptomyces sp. NPDC047002]|uniref:glycosyltransferase n=1 Tax=Streptomyces sp. NPDC047002 TaxID=3155475 RepID=UPI003453CFCC
MSGRPAACAVIVPAHQEGASLPATLHSLRAAARHPEAAGVPVLLVVVADACTDGTAAVAQDAGALVVRESFRNVGRARASGARVALRRLAAYGDTLWLATTDADTVVPPRWLAHQLRHARQGWECVVGTVRLAPHPPLSAVTAARHDAHYFAQRPPGRGAWRHPHVHGANLGVAAWAYTAAGGFPPLAHSEDHALVAALDRAGRRVLRTDDCPVLTSGRADSRAPRGFGSFLSALGGA